MNIGLLHWEEAHFGFLALCFLLLYLSLVYLPLLSPLTPLFICLTVPLCLLSYLTYSGFPSFLHPPSLHPPAPPPLSPAMAWSPSLSLFVPLAVSISLRRVSSTVDCILPPLLF